MSNINDFLKPKPFEGSPGRARELGTVLPEDISSTSGTANLSYYVRKSPIHEVKAYVPPRETKKPSRPISEYRDERERERQEESRLIAERINQERFAMIDLWAAEAKKRAKEFEMRKIEEQLPTAPKFKDIIYKTADFHRVPVNEIISIRRHDRIARPRQEIMWLGRGLTFRSLPEIGRMLGDRDHTTVRHGYRQVCKRNGLDPDDMISVKVACEKRWAEICLAVDGFAGAAE